MSGERMKEGKRRRREGKRGEDSVHVREEKEVEGENGMEGLTLIFSLSLSSLPEHLELQRKREGLWDLSAISLLLLSFSLFRLLLISTEILMGIGWNARNREEGEDEKRDPMYRKER